MLDNAGAVPTVMLVVLPPELPDESEFDDEQAVATTAQQATTARNLILAIGELFLSSNADPVTGPVVLAGRG